MNIQLTLASRYLRGRRLRSVLTTLAIVFGVLVIFGMNTVMPAFTRAFQASALAAAGQVDATITLRSGDVFDESAIQRVAALEGVRATSGHLNRSLNIPANYFDRDPDTADAISALALVGLNPEQASSVHAYIMKDGRFLQAGDTDAAVISESLAAALDVPLGGTFTMPSATGETTLTVVGHLPARALPGSEEVLVPLSQAQAMLDMPGQINTIEANFASMEEEGRSATEAAILDTLGDTFEIGTLSANSELLTNLRLGQMIFNLLGVLALLMGGFIIFNTFRTVVAERQRDIGMLRALGASRSTIFGIVIAEGLLQGVIGTILGLAVGYGLGWGLISLINEVTRQYLNTTLGAPVVSPGLVAGSVLMGVGVTLLAGLLPALNASRVTPVEALRPSVGALSLQRVAGLSFWSGVIMLALAVIALISRNVNLISAGGILFVLGLILASPGLVTPIATFFGSLLAVVFARDGTAQLAEGNISRQPSRAAITVSTTLIGMAILVMAASILSSVETGFGQVIRKSLGSDYILLPPSVAVWGGNIGAAPALSEELRSIEGVSVVSALRFAPSQANGMAIAVMGLDPVTYPEVSGLSFTKGNEREAYAELASGRNVILNGIGASTAGADVGDELSLITPSGRQSYRVAAIGGDFLNAKIATVYLSHDNMAADFNRDEDVLLLANLTPGADQDAVDSKLKAVVANYPQFRLVEGRAYIEESMALFDAAIAGLGALVLFLAIPSLIAMINTLAIGVIQRTREIGMLRAVGATRRQINLIILAEALILAGIGTAFGILSGLYLGYMAVGALATAGFPIVYIFPAAGVLLALAAGLLFGVLAAIIPARQASQLRIVQALRYE